MNFHQYPGVKSPQTYSILSQRSYLLVVDYTSRFPIVREIKSMSAQHIAEHFRLIFSDIWMARYPSK